MRTASATTPSPNDGPGLKVQLRKFSAEEENWDEWHNVYLSQAKILGFTAKLVATDEIRVGAENFSCQGINPLRAKRASEAWLFLVTSCKGTALEIVESNDLTSVTWREFKEKSERT